MNIDRSLVRRLVTSQFPQWAHLPVAAVEFDGSDHRTFRLGTDLSVRLPSAAAYAPQVAKEHRWLPVLAPQLPLPIPEPVEMGVPGAGYPWNWSIYSWLEGTIARPDRIADLNEFARTLAGFLAALQRIDPAGGPPPGRHYFFRGAPVEVYDAETRCALAALGDLVATETAIAVWEAAIATTWTGSSVWFHGDVSAGNLLTNDGRLSAVIDFGTSGVGDPAGDVTIAWTLLSGSSRAAFRAGLAVDAATWARGRGWALWKALITLAGAVGTDPVVAAGAAHVVNQVLADYEQSA